MTFLTLFTIVAGLNRRYYDILITFYNHGSDNHIYEASAYISRTTEIVKEYYWSCSVSLLIYPTAGEMDLKMNTTSGRKKTNPSKNSPPIRDLNISSLLNFSKFMNTYL